MLSRILGSVRRSVPRPHDSRRHPRYRNANADPERSGPAVAIVVGDAAYLVDAGPGIVRRALRLRATIPLPRSSRRAFAVSSSPTFIRTTRRDSRTSALALGARPADPLDVFGPRVRSEWSNSSSRRLGGRADSAARRRAVQQDGLRRRRARRGRGNRLPRQQRDGHGIQRVAREMGTGPRLSVRDARSRRRRLGRHIAQRRRDRRLQRV